MDDKTYEIIITLFVYFSGCLTSYCITKKDFGTTEKSDTFLDLFILPLLILVKIGQAILILASWAGVIGFIICKVIDKFKHE